MLQFSMRLQAAIQPADYEVACRVLATNRFDTGMASVGFPVAP